MSRKIQLDPADASTLGYMAEALRDWDFAAPRPEVEAAIRQLFAQLTTPSGREIAIEMARQRRLSLAPRPPTWTNALATAAAGLLVWAGLDALLGDPPRRRTRRSRAHARH